MNNFIQLLDRPIAYNPSFAKLRVGNVKSGPVAAVFLSQMVYWHNRMDGGWVYKTQADITSETALSRDEQETARKRLVALGVLDEQRRGVPATMHYRVNALRLEELLIATTKPAKKAPKEKTRTRHIQNVETPQSGLVHSRNQECGNAANKNVETPQTSLVEPNKQVCGSAAIFPTGNYTENTQETTQKKNTLGQPPLAADRDDKFSEEIHVTDQAILVLKHLNLMTGAKYTTAKTTLENIRARLVDGHTVDELKTVVEYMSDRWLGTEWSKHLTPPTIFHPAKFPANLLGAQAWELAGRKTAQKSEPVNTAERDDAFKRLVANPGKPLNRTEELAKRAAGSAGLGRMNEVMARSSWKSIWAEAVKSAAEENQQGRA